MSSAIMPPKAGKKTSKKKGKRRSSAKASAAKTSTSKASRKRSSRKGRRSVTARMGKVKNDLQSLGVFWGQVAGSAAVASAAKGYLGDKINIMGKVDGRLAVGAVLTALKLSGKAPSGWDTIVTNVATGTLTSWLSDKAFEYGGRFNPAAVPEPAPAATKTEGMVIGNIYGNEAGAFWQSREKRLERKLQKGQELIAKAKQRADRHDIDLDNLAKDRDDDDDDARGGAVRIVRRAPVVVAPPVRPIRRRVWFRGPRRVLVRR